MWHIKLRGFESYYILFGCFGTDILVSEEPIPGSIFERD